MTTSPPKNNRSRSLSQSNPNETQITSETKEKRDDSLPPRVGVDERNYIRSRDQHDSYNDNGDRYKIKLCEYYPKCPNGNNCKFAHGKHELRKSVKNYKTAMCRDLPNCRAGKACNFAHDARELRRYQHDTYSKSRSSSSSVYKHRKRKSSSISSDFKTRKTRRKRSKKSLSYESDHKKRNAPFIYENMNNSQIKQNDRYRVKKSVDDIRSRSVSMNLSDRAHNGYYDAEHDVSGNDDNRNRMNNNNINVNDNDNDNKDNTNLIEEGEIIHLNKNLTKTDSEIAKEHKYLQKTIANYNLNIKECREEVENNAEREKMIRKEVKGLKNAIKESVLEKERTKTKVLELKTEFKEKKEELNELEAELLKIRNLYKQSCENIKSQLNRIKLAQNEYESILKLKMEGFNDLVN